MDITTTLDILWVIISGKLDLLYWKQVTQVQKIWPI